MRCRSLKITFWRLDRVSRHPVDSVVRQTSACWKICKNVCTTQIASDSKRFLQVPFGTRKCTARLQRGRGCTSCRKSGETGREHGAANQPSRTYDCLQDAPCIQRRASCTKMSTKNAASGGHRSEGQKSRRQQKVSRQSKSTRNEAGCACKGCSLWVCCSSVFVHLCTLTTCIM